MTQDDTWDRPVPTDEDEDGDDETGYILAAIRHRELFRQSEEWYVGHALVEHVCSPRDFEWIAIESSKNHQVETETLPMELRDGRKIWSTFYVCDVNGPFMSVGKLNTKVNCRRATFTTRGGVLWQEEAGEVLVDTVRKHHDLECWVKPGNVMVPVQVGASSGSASEPAGTFQQHHNEQMLRS